MVCLQNAQTKDNEAAMKGVKEIKADEQFRKWTEVVKVDPSDPKEARAGGATEGGPEDEEAGYSRAGAARRSGDQDWRAPLLKRV